MAELERKYADKPVHFFHVTCGENALQAIDFKKHYRSEATFLLDTNYQVSEAYQAGSWPTTVIVNAAGEIVGRWVGVTEPANWKAAMQALDASVASAPGGPPKGAHCVGDKCYVRSARTYWDSEPAMIADATGKPHLFFTRERGGSGDIFHQVLTGDIWSEPERVTTSAGDDYSPAACADGEHGVRLVWVSDRATSGKYDVWTKRFDGSEWSVAERVTETNDDAAHPRCAVDTSGHFWVTYYAWVPWGQGQSRDREIYVRYHDGKTWSDEQQISPSDVPKYEDHADPAIAADASGNVWIAWAWDTHPQAESWPFDPTFGSAIFARQLRAGQPASQVMMVAMRARSLGAAMNAPHWAFAPELVCVGDVPHFAFEAHMPGADHACAITTYVAGEGFPAPTRLGINDKFVCTPRIIANAQGELASIWSAPLSRNDTIQVARRDASGNWSPGRLAWADGEVSLSTPSAAFDSAGRLWVAAVATKPNESKVVVKMMR